MSGGDARTRCACGCGQVIPSSAKFARGHWARTAEAREKNAVAARARAAKEREEARTASEQAIPEQVSERRFTADEVVTMLNLLDIPDDRIERFIDLTALLETLR